jgi:predicted secreted acid phosphatase
MLANEPLENFGAIRYRIADYADCKGGGGCYWADLDAQYTRAQAALKLALAPHKPSDRVALVLDIDETTLSSYCEMQQEDFGYVKPLFESWIVSPAASIPIPGTLRLYKQARAAGVAVFFITGRPDEQRAATAANLKTAGFEGWAGLSLRVGAQKTMPAAEYKSQERQKIVDAGYSIAMNVGDQWSDLDGTARAAINVKLPNPFYYLP